VFVVDHKDGIRRMLRRVRQERGLVVREATRGSETLPLVREQVADLILLDAMLSEIHGFDIGRDIKGSRTYGHIPITMLRAIDRGWRLAKDLREFCGVANFLKKPFDLRGRIRRRTRLERLVGRRANRRGRAFGAGLRSAGRQHRCLQAKQHSDASKQDEIDGAIAHLRRRAAINLPSFMLHDHRGLRYRRWNLVFERDREMETSVDLAPRHVAARKNFAVRCQPAGFEHRAIEIGERTLGSVPDEETHQATKAYVMSLL
jgi:DNA-binding response OmpR family regulator